MQRLKSAWIWWNTYDDLFFSALWSALSLASIMEGSYVLVPMAVLLAISHFRIHRLRELNKRLYAGIREGIDYVARTQAEILILKKKGEALDSVVSDLNERIKG